MNLQFLNRKTLEPPISKSGTLGTFSSYTGKHWNHPFLSREHLEPLVPKQKNNGTTHF